MPSTPWYRLTPEQVSADVTRQLRYQIRKRVRLARKHDKHIHYVSGCPFCVAQHTPQRKIHQLQILPERT